MDERTIEFLKERFGDYYRQVSFPEDELERRELGYIPWATGKTIMNRHESLSTIGTPLADQLSEWVQPRHMYQSVAEYEYPTAGNMKQKEWQKADLIFDIDDDHIPGIDADDPPNERLKAAKNETQKLLQKLEDEFNISEYRIVFSGRRGYHVHVKDDSYQKLNRNARTELVRSIKPQSPKVEDYIFESVATKEKIINPTGSGRIIREKIPDVLDEIYEFAREIFEQEDEETIDQIVKQELQNQYSITVSEKVVEDVFFYEYIDEDEKWVIDKQDKQEQLDRIRDGRIPEKDEFKTFHEQLIKYIIRSHVSTYIDDPVTTDTHRLIRTPETLHGGSGLIATEIENISNFEPFSDAVPAQFRNNTIDITVTEDTTTNLYNTSQTFSEGQKTEVDEAVAINLFCKETAELR